MSPSTISRCRLAGVAAATVLIAGTALGQGPIPSRGGADLFVLDLAGTPVGEIPTGIRQLSGILEVVIKDGAPMLKASARSEFLITLPQLLPQDVTFTFDVMPKLCCNPQDLSFEGTPLINQGTASAHIMWDSDGSLQVVGGGAPYDTPMPKEFRSARPPSTSARSMGSASRFSAGTCFPNPRPCPRSCSSPRHRSSRERSPGDAISVGSALPGNHGLGFAGAGSVTCPEDSW